MTDNQIAVVEPEQSKSSLEILRPIATPQALVSAHEEVTRLIKDALTHDTDYGMIQGTKKETLYKAGAERICLAFGAAPTYECVDKEIDHYKEVPWVKRKKQWNNAYQGDRSFKWVEETGQSLGLYRYVYKCRIVREGRILAEGVGTCSTLEAKYIDRPRECENTVCKMAQKRAFIAATLHAFGLSDRFTQDVEDMPREHFQQDEPPSNETPAPRQQKTTSSKPKTNGKPKVYKGTPEEEQSLAGFLKRMNIPEQFWEEIGNQMIDRPFPDIALIAKKVQQEASN